MPPIAKQTKKDKKKNKKGKLQSWISWYFPIVTKKENALFHWLPNVSNTESIWTVQT